MGAFCFLVKVRLTFIMPLVIKRAKDFVSVREHSAGPKLTSFFQNLRLMIQKELDLKLNCWPRFSWRVKKKKNVLLDHAFLQDREAFWHLDFGQTRGQDCSAAPMLQGPSWPGHFLLRTRLIFFWDFYQNPRISGQAPPIRTDCIPLSLISTVPACP